MATPSSMVLRALRLIGVKGIGDTLTSGEQTAYLSDLNAMLESWSLERLLCYQILTESHALTTSVGSYTIGSGGAINTTRPTKIVDPCFIRDSSNRDTPVRIIEAVAYGAIPDKTADGSTPECLYYDASFATSLATIYLYPEPAASLTLHFSSWKQLQSFAAITTTVVLPPGYQRAIEFNLAIELAGGLANVPDSVASMARQSKAAIKSVNQRPLTMHIDPALLGGVRGNILRGY